MDSSFDDLLSSAGGERFRKPSSLAPLSTFLQGQRTLLSSFFDTLPGFSRHAFLVQKSYLTIVAYAQEFPSEGSLHA